MEVPRSSAERDGDMPAETSDAGEDLWRPEWERAILEKISLGKGKNEALRFGGGWGVGGHLRLIKII